MTYAFILGRNKDLSTAELGAFFGNKVKVSKNGFCAFIEGELPFASPQDFLDRLGGSVEILEIFERNVLFADIEQKITIFLKKKCATLTGKCTFGLNLLPVNKKSQVLKTFLPRIKKNLKADGLSSGFVNNDFQNVNEVFAFKHGLHKLGTNIWMVEEGEGRVSLGFSIAAQNFESYSKRDYGKPFRDAKAGMLPPKLAQIMINLCHPEPVEGRHSATVFDPFCGTGTILMEAMLMGCSVAGSDVDPKMVAGSEQNLAWLRQNFKSTPELESKIFHKSATELSSDVIASHAIAVRSNLLIVTEPYLGPPLSTFPAPAFLEKVLNELSTLYLGFFKSIASWLPKGSSVVFLFPYWKKSNIEKVRSSERLVAKIEALGYIKTAFDPLKTTSLFYERPDQIVGREIMRFIKT
jgi:tRNA G10  N-methylase Trm11